MTSYGFLLDLAIILFATKLFGLLTRRISLPQVVGAIVAGLIIGPSCFNIVKDTDFISTMAELGVVMLMFSAGLETDMQELKKTGLASTVIACMGVLFPVIGGFLVHALYLGKIPSVSDPEFLQSIFTGVILAATSVSITVETLREMGKLKTKVGTAIMGAAVIDDVIGIIILTLVMGMKDPSSSPLSVILNIGAFLVFSLVAGLALHYIFKYMDQRFPNKRRMTVMSLAACFAFAYCAEEFFGIADITGAYICGILLCNFKSTGSIAERVDVSSFSIFSPVFFASIGLKTVLSDFTASVVVFTIALIIVSMVTKQVGCYLAARMFHFNHQDSMRIGIGMISRGEVALIVAQKGAAVGLMDSALFAPVILMVVATSIVTPILLKLSYRKEDAVPPKQQSGSTPLSNIA